MEVSPGGRSDRSGQGFEHAFDAHRDQRKGASLAQSPRLLDRQPAAYHPQKAKTGVGNGRISPAEHLDGASDRQQISRSLMLIYRFYTST